MIKINTMASVRLYVFRPEITTKDNAMANAATTNGMKDAMLSESFAKGNPTKTFPRNMDVAKPDHVFHHETTPPNMPRLATS